MNKRRNGNCYFFNTGLEEGLIKQIEIYPNPAKDQTLFESKKPLNGTLSLYNLQGQQVWQETVASSRQKVVPLHSLAPGIYVLRFLSEDGKFSRKILK